jgi:hypothetical protein
MLKRAYDLIDCFIDEIDDIRKLCRPLDISRAVLVDEDSIESIAADMKVSMSADDAAKAELYLRLKLAV